MKRAPQFERTRETTWLMLTLIVVSYAGLAFVISSHYPGRVAQALEEARTATGGLIAPAISANLPVLFVLGFIVFGVIRMRPSDVGWHASGLGPALVVIVAFWIAMQSMLALAATFGDGLVMANWAERRPSFVAGDFIGVLLGTALIEETVFRGLLLPQFYKKVSRRYSLGIALLVAVVGSQVAFALFHIPHDMFVRNLAGPQLLMGQLQRFVLGLMFAATYLVTQNLFVCMGLHAILNEPPSLIVLAGDTAQGVWVILLCVLLISWLQKKRPLSVELS